MVVKYSGIKIIIVCKKKMKLCHDIESNPGPEFVDQCKTVRGNFHQGNDQLFSMNAGKQCVGNSLVAIIFNAAVSCFRETWDSSKMDNILHLGNGLYSYIYSLLRKDLLLLNEIPSAISLGDKTYRLLYSESITGDVNMMASRDCYFPLLEALCYVKSEYNACLLTIFCNTVAIFFSENKVKLFDSHSRDVCGNRCSEGSSVLLEFSALENLVGYLQRFYSHSKIVPFELKGVNVTELTFKECGSNAVTRNKEEGDFHEGTKVRNTESKINKDCSADSGVGMIRQQKRRERKIETAEQRALRLQKVRERNQVQRQSESNNERKIRLDKGKSG